MKNLLLACAFALLPLQVIAADLIFGEPGHVSGITGLESDGQLYNVEFAYMAFEDIPAEQTPFMGDVEGARQAFIDINTALESYYLYHDNTTGWDHIYGIPYILYSTGPSVGFLVSGRNTNYPPASWEGGSVRGASPGSDYSYALITPVPLPAAAWLFLSALGGLGIIKRNCSEGVLK